MAYPACPKCRHAPLPVDQAFPAECPACGLILAKFTAATVRPAVVPASNNAIRIDDADAPRDPDGDRHLIARWICPMPTQVDRVSWIGRIVVLVVFCLWTVWIWSDMDIPDGDPGSRFLHLVLTPFHEAGHYAIFRWFGRFIMILGGTLGQHLMPIVLGVALLAKRRDAFGAAIFFWLLGFSVSDMGVYMFDAFDPKLMLLDGKTGAESDGHDWQNIFGDLGLLKHARGIGVFFGGVGRVMMAMGLAWAAWMIWLQKARLSDSPFAETEHE